jgi:hypothetical protein
MTKQPMDPLAKRILLDIGTPDALSASRKKSYFLSPFFPGMSCPSFWDGGSKSYWHFYHTLTGKAWEVPENHPVFLTGRPYYIKQLPPHSILVRTGIFCGKPASAHLYMPTSPSDVVDTRHTPTMKEIAP